MASYYGRRRTSADTDYGVAGAGEQRAVVFNAFPENGWVTHLGAWVGKVTTAPSFQIAMWDESGGNPNNRLGYTSSQTASTLMADSTGGASVEAAVTTVNATYSPGTNAIKCSAGAEYAIGWLPVNYSMGHGMVAAATLGDPSANVVFYTKTGLSLPPNNPFTSYTTSDPEGWLSVWAKYVPNTAPSTPTSLSPTGTITSLTPTFNAAFVDAESAYGDAMKQYTITVRIAGGGATVWTATTYTASNTEKTANQVQKVYAGGTALVAGTSYEWRIKVSDQFGTFSSYTAWTSFTVAGGGTVTLYGGTPTGKQTAVSGYTFQAKWSHLSGTAMTHAKIRLLQGGTQVQIKTGIAKAVVSSAAPGTAFTISWAESTFVNLGWGGDYAFQIAGSTDSGATYSEWSTEQSFNTNDIPNAATSTSPATGITQTTPPMITFQGTDGDDTPLSTGGSLTATCRIKGAPLVQNASMYGNIATWAAYAATALVTATYTYDATSLDTTVPASGRLKCAITPNTSGAGSNAEFIQNVNGYFPCVVGESYTIGGYISTDNANIHPRLKIYWYTAAKALISTSNEADWSPSINTTYLRSFTATAPATAAFFRVGGFTYLVTASVTGNAYYDGFTVSRGTRYARVPAWSVANSRWEYQTVSGTDPVVTIDFSGTVTGGTYTITVDGATTGAIAYNASAATVQAALDALSTVGFGVAGSVTCTGGPGPTDIVCTFKLNRRANPITMTVASSVTGGGTVTATNTTTGVTSDLETYGTYAWDVALVDASNTGAYSTEATFIYATGPTPVLSAPTGTITTSTPTVTWTVTGQVKYQVKIYRDAALTDMVYDSGLITSATTSQVVTSGLLVNGTTYYTTVSVTDSLSLVGTSAALSFTLTYVAPTTLTNMTAVAVTAAFDETAASVQINWGLTTYAPDVFVAYFVSYWEAGETEADEIVIARITAISQGQFTYCFPQSNVSITYAVRQVIMQGTDETESVRATADVQIELTEAVVCSAVAPLSYRMAFRWDTAREFDPQTNSVVLKVWGDALPTILVDSTDYRIIAGKFSIATSRLFSATESINMVREMRARKEVCCYRDERGRKAFGFIRKARESDRRGNIIDVDFEMVECAHSEVAADL